MRSRVLQYFGLGRKSRRGEPAGALLDDEDDPALMMTGEALTTAILENIRLRRSVLVTGPRGCGKSYCSEQAIKLAKMQGIIGGSRFLQGNREIPRDALSEDMLIVDEAGKVKLLKALALRPLEESGTVTREGFPDWPGIPRGVGIDDPTQVWTNRDWMVLFLDEINRFGDGFLDSLLALLEERKIVRRGQDYYVPIIVVATANPPGYDMTAKKLSPPLQARITRSFRVSQPDVETLVHEIMPSKIRDFARSYPDDQAPEVPPEVRYLAAGTTLCLWGDPSAGSKGRYFLTRSTRDLLLRLMASNDDFARDMRELATLIDFGPDARAITDWVGCAMARAATERARRVTPKHLEETAVHVLSHKVREKFNEGANPNLGIRRDRLILNIVQRVMNTPGWAERFGYKTAKQGAAKPARSVQELFAPVTLSQLEVAGIIGEFSNARIFVETLVNGYPRYREMVLVGPDHVRVWVNTIDGTLQPYATPGDVQQIVTQGFWALVRLLRPGQQLVDMRIIRLVGELYERSYHALEEAANPAGQERARLARQVVTQVVDTVSRSPANPQNTPHAARPGTW
jgi:MoxR-like ATPase